MEIMLLILMLNPIIPVNSKQNHQIPSISTDEIEITELSKLRNGEAVNYNIRLLDNYLYVADGPGGFKILDIANKTDPSLSYRFVPSSFDEVVWNLQVLGDNLFIINFDTLEIYDISDREDPQILSTVSVGEVDRIVFSGNYAYLTGQYSRFTVVDIADPSIPEVVFQSSSYYFDLDIYGNFVYLTEGTFGSSNLDIYDITDPSNPTLQNSIAYSHSTGEIEIHEGILYVSIEDIGIEIYDLLDPKNPNLVNTIVDTSLFRLNLLSIEGDLLYIANFGSSLNVYNISQYDNIIEIETFYGEDIKSVAEIDSYLYIGDKMTGDIRIFNRTNNLPSQHVETFQDYNDEYVDVKIEDGYAFYASVYDGMSIFSVTDMQNPIKVGTFDVPIDVEVNDLNLYNETAYLSTNDGLYVIDVMDPSQPNLLGILLNSSEDSFETIIEGNSLYVSMKSGVSEFDISDPANISLIGEYISDEYDFFQFLENIGDYLFLLTVWGELEILDKSGINITLVNSYDFEFYIDSLAIDAGSNQLYVFDVLSKFGYLDVSDVMNPSFTELDLDINYGLHVEGDFLFSSGTDSLSVFQKINGTYQKIADEFYYDIQTNVRRVRDYEMMVSENILYVSTLEGGRILQYNEVIAPPSESNSSDPSDNMGSEPGFILFPISSFFLTVLFIAWSLKRKSLKKKSGLGRI